MVIQIEPQSGNARIGSDGLSNAYLGVDVVRQEGTLPISTITQNGTIPSANLATGFGSGIVISKPPMNLAYFRRPDQLQVNVDAGLLRQNEAPYQPLLDQDGVAELAEFVASIIQMPTQTSSPGTTATSLNKQSDVRIGVMIPAYILYQRQLYKGTGQSVATTNHTPADLSLLGSGLEAGDQRGVAVPGSGPYDIYAIEGTSQEKAIAVKLQGRSSNGPVWVWLRYERKK